MVEINITDLLRKLENCIRQSEADPYLPVVLEKVKLILYEIKQCKNVENANIYFDLLDQVQYVMCGLVFRDNIIVSQELRKFVRDCDRLDDPWLRDYLFKKIKSDEYNLASDAFL